MILALKTDGPTTEMVLVTGKGTDATYTWDSGRTLADHLLARIRGFLEEYQAEINDLTGIVIFAGPGSFTSLRIGHTVANALADSVGIPIVGTEGEGWFAEGVKALKTAKPGHPALPHYGAEAHITKPGA